MRPSVTSGSSVLKNVQVLRAVAATLVVFVHMQLPHNGIDVAPHPILRVFAEFGKFGVDMFFAISGFIMLVTNWDAFAQPKASLKFFLARVARIYPAYWLALAPVALTFFLARSRFMAGHDAANTDVLASILLYPQPVLKVLLPISWTLTFEMTFYIIFAGILLLNRRYAVHALLVWLAVQLALFAAFDASADPFLKYLSNAQPMEFILGAFVGIWFRTRPQPGPVVALAIGVAGALVAWYACVFHQPAFTSTLGRVLCFGLPAGFILYGAVGLERRGVVFATPLLLLLGDASYATYLWHFALIGVLRQAVLKLHPHGIAMEVGIILACLAIILAWSVGVYRVFERPVTRALNARIARLLRFERARPALVPAPAAVD